MWSVKTFLIVLIVASVVENNKSDALKILGIFPPPVKSHFVVGEVLLKVLADRGHQVDVVNHFPQKKKYPNYTDISLVGALPGTLNNITISDTKNFSSLSFARLVQVSGADSCDLLSSHHELQVLLKKPKNSYDVVIVGVRLYNIDEFFPFIYHIMRINRRNNYNLNKKINNSYYNPSGEI